MLDRWLDSQDQAIRHWLLESKCPMVVSQAGGALLWVNGAAEDLFGYSSAEVLGLSGVAPLSWEDLTVDQRDLKADQAMVEQMVAGDRVEYTLEKSYRAKDGHAIPCKIHVLRWPPSGEADCLLVTVLPLQAEQELLRKELVAMKSALGELVERQVASVRIESPVWGLLKSFGAWANANKVAAACLILWLSALFLGDQVLVIAERIKTLFAP